MKKHFRITTAILIIIALLSIGGVIYFTQLESDVSTYYAYIMIVILVGSMANLISRFQQRQQLKKENLLESRLKLWNNISYKVKKAGETAFNELPIGIVIINQNHTIMWANKSAKRIFLSPLEKINLANISQPLNDKLLSEDGEFQIGIYGSIYHIQYLKEHHVIYLTDITQRVRVETKYENRVTGIGYINIDNLEEALVDFDVQERAEYMGKIIGIIAKWAESYGIYVRAYSDMRYLIIMDYAQLQEIMHSNFTILDEIKTIWRSSKLIRISLSIGIACDDINIDDLSKLANDQMELALNRGGDQAIVKIGEKAHYFGAKTDPTPKDSKVEIRVKSEELQELITSSKAVYVMGHKAIDADGFGATLGIYKLAKSMGKNAYMVLDPDSMDVTVERIYDSIKREYIGLIKDIVHPNDAVGKIDNKTLLVIVDCQSEQMVIDSRLLKKTDKIAIIDHHRKGGIPIANPSFYYAKTSSSSSVELVVELLQFYEQAIELDALEATWMLIGIIVDTNNFIYRTSDKTFEVAATLKRYGADMLLVKQYLKEEFDEKRLRNEFLDHLEIYKEHTGIAASRTAKIYERATLAKVSDEIISILGVKVGLTIGYIGENEVGISARSLGEVNVQMIMERLGGGGHLNNAAAQIKNKDIPTIVKELKELMDEFLEKEGNMKVILIKEVKGRGKRGDIIDLQAGFANHLIRSGQAVIASSENIKTLDQEKREKEIKAQKHLAEMKELKKKIEETPIKIGVKVGNEGKLFGSVSMKQVVDTFEKETGIALDKRKINSIETIASLGTFEIPIQLHKEVVASICLHVVEKE